VSRCCHDNDERQRTVSLSSLDFLEQALEPSEGGCVAADPEELDAAERAKLAFLLSVPDVLQDRRERGNTYK
jgi:hypothetical protein